MKQFKYMGSTITFNMENSTDIDLQTAQANKQAMHPSTFLLMRSGKPYLSGHDSHIKIITKRQLNWVAKMATEVQWWRKIDYL